MGSKTISLEDSAYGKLRRAKRRDESFSDVVHRLTNTQEPSLLEFTRLFDTKGAEEIAAIIARAREEDIALQRERHRRGR